MDAKHWGFGVLNGNLPIKTNPQCLHIRDADYYDFFVDMQWQLPNKYFYNHDPVYATVHHNPTFNRKGHSKQVVLLMTN